MSYVLIIWSTLLSLWSKLFSRWSRLFSLTDNQDTRLSYADTYFKRLSDDILTEILTRLPVESLLEYRQESNPWCPLITSQAFVEAHLERAPAITIALFDSSVLGEQRSDAVMFSIEDLNDTTKLKRVRTESFPNMSQHKLDLLASCNGMLLLQNFEDRDQPSPIILYNPTTKEEVRLLQIPKRNVCGFFFHRPSSEYQFIMLGYRESYVRYYLWSSRTQRETHLGTHAFRPTRWYASVNLSNYVCWIANYNDGQVDIPQCQKCIMMFSFDTRTFSVTAHPGHICDTDDKSKHARVRLLDIDNRLAFLDFRNTLLSIWILEDTVNFTWVMRHEIDLQAFNDFPDIHYFTYDWDVQVLNFLNGELLLMSANKGLFWYNLGTNQVRSINMGRDMTSEMMIADANGVTCIQSLVSPRQISV